MKSLLVVATLLAAASSGVAQVIICYYANWSRYGTNSFAVENINPALCTHIVYSFMGLSENGNVRSDDPWNDYGDEWTEGGLVRFGRLRKSNPSVKLLLGVGGWNQGPLNFQAVVKSPEKRKTFLQSSLSLIEKYNFDGLEIDWVYQDSWGGTPADKTGYSALVKEMKPEYDKKKYILGISTLAHPRVIANSYDIPSLSQNVNYINVMTYDLHGQWDGKTGHMSPLYPMTSETEEQKLFNVKAVIGNYIEKGASPAKLNVGVVGYGRTFTLANSKNRGMNAPTTGPGRIEPLPYNTFCVQDKEGQWEKFWEVEQKVPYAVSGDQWVGYEDYKSLEEKIKFIKSKKLGGITFWTLDMDDFKGSCGNGKFPLLNIIKNQMSKN